MIQLTERRDSRSPGFTIIEIVMVLAVFGILVSTAVYRMSPALDSARVNHVASVLVADLQYAQVVAARQRRPVVILVSPMTQSYEIRDSRSITVFRQRLVGPGTDYGVDSMTASPTSIEVFPNGATVQSATVTLGLNGKVKTVTFSRAGQIRVS